MANWNAVITIFLKKGETAEVYYRLSPTLRQNGLFVYMGQNDNNPTMIAQHGGELNDQTGNYVISNTGQQDNTLYLADWEVAHNDPPLPALGHQASFWGDPGSAGVFYSTSGGPNQGVGGGCSDVVAAVYVQKR